MADKKINLAALQWQEQSTNINDSSEENVSGEEFDLNKYTDNLQKEKALEGEEVIAVPEKPELKVKDEVPTLSIKKEEEEKPCAKFSLKDFNINIKLCEETTEETQENKDEEVKEVIAETPKIQVKKPKASNVAIAKTQVAVEEKEDKTKSIKIKANSEIKEKIIVTPKKKDEEKPKMNLLKELNKTAEEKTKNIIEEIDKIELEEEKQLSKEEEFKKETIAILDGDTDGAIITDANDELFANYECEDNQDIKEVVKEVAIKEEPVKELSKEEEIELKKKELAKLEEEAKTEKMKAKEEKEKIKAEKIKAKKEAKAKKAKEVKVTVKAEKTTEKQTKEVKKEERKTRLGLLQRFKTKKSTNKSEKTTDKKKFLENANKAVVSASLFGVVLLASAGGFMLMGGDLGNTKGNILEANTPNNNPVIEDVVVTSPEDVINEVISMADTSEKADTEITPVVTDEIITEEPVMTNPETNIEAPVVQAPEENNIENPVQEPIDNTVINEIKTTENKPELTEEQAKKQKVHNYLLNRYKNRKK